jgi:hypothetical protein
MFHVEQVGVSLRKTECSTWNNSTSSAGTNQCIQPPVPHSSQHHRDEWVWGDHHSNLHPESQYWIEQMFHVEHSPTPTPSRRHSELCSESQYLGQQIVPRGTILGPRDHL